MDYGLILAGSNGLNFRCINDGFVSIMQLHKTLIDTLESCGLL